MATPRVIQQQLEAAEALAAAQASAAGPDMTGVATDVAQLIQPPAPAVEPPPQPSAPPPAPAVQPEDWEHKYRSLQGKYQREVPELRASLASQQSQVVALSEQVRVLTAAMAKPPEAPAKPAVDQKDVEAFGNDMMDMVQRYITATAAGVRTEFTNALTALDGRLKALEQNVQGVTEKTNTSLEAQFYARLAELVPDWQDVNDKPRWLEWLAETDPAFGVPRQAALDDAQARFDAQRVAALFNQFKAATAAPAPASVEALISPSTTGAAPAPTAAPAKSLVTQKAIEAFYNDVVRGRYRGREAEVARIEAEINQAIAEGRVV